ncbi:MAG: NAD(P)-dependent oxidoreductase [Verrucomicrobiae bacterium]|nr:NAD(P)-dependent oxidoreductase [Verrucomicrobiae bacterium]
MKILLTGASSFTGFWFVKALAAAGHEVVCPLTGESDRYTDVRRQRVEILKPLCRLVPNAPFGSEAFLKLAGAEKFDRLCQHAAEVANYKSADFDAVRALQNNSLNLRGVLPALQCPVVLTGSVFENDEGIGAAPRAAFSPYGLSKGLTFQVFRFYCHAAGVPLGKFVIPNPFGPFEEPRFTAFLMRNWKAGQPVEVKTPDYVRDNIHVDLLALAYAAFVTAPAREPLRSINPSGYAEKQGAFAQRVAREVKARTGWACALKLAQQADFSEPLDRVNSEPATKLFPGWNEKSAWDDLTRFYAA